MNKIIFLSLILIELVIVSLLGFKIYKRKNDILGAVKVNPIKKEVIVFNPSGALKYYYEPKSNSKQKDSGFLPSHTVVYTINSDSLNERFDYSLKKPEDTYRIITLGDSFTFGGFVDTKDNWTEQLEDMLNINLSCKNIKKFEVINLGVYGYDIQYSVERFKIRGKKYNPDLVLWFLKNDDFDQVQQIVHKNEDYYTEEMKKTGEWEKLSERGIRYPPHIKLMEDMDIFRDEMGEEKIVDFQKKCLEQISLYFKKGLLIFTFPFLQNSYKDILIKFKNSRPDTYFFDQLTNIYEVSEATISNDGHPSKKGHKIIAQDILRHLINNHIMSRECTEKFK